MMNKVVHSVAALAAFVLSAAAPCAAAASTISKSTEEWSTSVTVSRGQEHTFWITGLTPETDIYWMDVEATYTDADGDEAWLSVFESATTEDEEGNITGMYMLLTAEDWEDVTKSSLKFTVTVYGSYDEDHSSADRSFTFGHAAGRDKFPTEPEPEDIEPYGSTEDVAQAIRPMAQLLPGTNYTAANEFVPRYEEIADYPDGYFFSLRLVAGQKYVFGIVTNKPNVSVSAEIYNKTDAADLVLTGQPYDKYWPDCVMSVAIVATRTGMHYVNVRGDSREYSLRCVPIKARALSEHAQTPIAVDAGPAVSESFKPGRAVDPANGCYDAIIDDGLFRITGFKAGENYVFRTTGAKTNLIMRLYDGKGAVIAENRYRGLTNLGCDCNVQLAWSVAAADVAAEAVYVGVAQDLADDAEKSDDPGDVRVLVERVTPVNGTTVVSAVPGFVVDPRTAPGVRPSGPRSLGTNEWVNTFVMAARANTVYSFKIRPCGAGASVTNLLPISATAYTLTSGGERTVLATAIEEIGPFAEGSFDFRTGTDHGEVYIDVAVSDAGPQGAGKGLEFGPYELCGFAVSGAAVTGFLEVDMKGAPQDKMAWKLLKRNGKSLSSPTEVYYAPGAGVAIPTGTYVIAVQAVSVFAKPLSPEVATLDVGPWSPALEPVTYLYSRTDKYDPLDDAPDTAKKEPLTGKKYAPTKLSPSAAKPATGSHALWKNDSNDWYVISAAAGNFYRIELTETTGNPAVKVFGPGNWTNEVEYSPITGDTGVVHTEAVQFCAAEKGKYYVKVFHGDATGAEKERVDSTYVITASTYAPGQVKLTKTEYFVKNDATCVDVGVSRTGDGGTVRVKFRTVAVTAQPNTEYYPTNGVITWRAKDKKERKIRINLIPDIVPARATSNLEFKVQFETFAAGERIYTDEFIPSFANGQTVTVKLTRGEVKYPKTPEAKGVRQEFLKEKSTATWTAKAYAGCVFAGWVWAKNGTPAAAFKALSENERKNPSLKLKIAEGEKVRPEDVAATWAWIDEDLIESVAIDTNGLRVVTKSYVTATVSGLPSGLRFNAKTLAITGAVKAKDKTYAVKVSVKNASGYTWKRTFSFVVAGNVVTKVDPANNPVTTGVAVMLWCDSTMGTVTKSLVCALGKAGTKKVSIKATAAKGHVFAGWYLDPAFANPAVLGKDYREASQSIIVTDPTYLYARFVEKSVAGDPIADFKYTGAGYCGEGTSAEVETWYQGVALPTNACAVSFASASLPTVTVSGLPSGVKFDKQACRFTGVPTASSTEKKPFFKVKISVKNKSGATDVLVKNVYVEPLPAWAVGNFDGYHMEEGATNGTFTATVGKTGKVSGKTKGGLAATTFSAKSFSGVFTVDGALCYIADVTVSYKDPATKKTVKATDTLYLMENPLTALGEIGNGGVAGYGCGGVQRAWERKDLAYPAFPTGKAALTCEAPMLMDLKLKFGAKGKVTVSGKVPGDDLSPVPASGTTCVLPFAWEGYTNLFAQTCVYVAPKKNLASGFCEVYNLKFEVKESAPGKKVVTEVKPQLSSDGKVPVPPVPHPGPYPFVH